MIWSSSYDVVVKATVDCVIVPLKDGICSLNTVYMALIDADVDPFTNRCSNYNYIRQHIVQAEWRLRQTEVAANSGLRCLDGSLEKFMEDEGKLEREKRATEQTLHKLKIKQSSNENLLRESEGGLRLARGNLSSTRETLRHQIDRKNIAGIITGIGLGVTLIPFVGWVAGPAMAIGGAIEMDNAEKAIKVAKEEVRSCKSQVDKYKSKVSNYESSISQTKRDISQKNDRLWHIRNNIHKVREQKANIADFQIKVRSAVQVLSTLSGRASVAEHQTRRFILQEPVMKVMDDLMKATEKITGNELLHNNGILCLIDNMRQYNHQLAAICASQSNAEENDYY